MNLYEALIRKSAELRSWLRSVSKRSRLEAEMEAELAAHLELLTADLIRSGESPSDRTRSRGHAVVGQASVRPAIGIGPGLRRTIGEAHGVIGCRNGCVVCLLLGDVRGAGRKKRQRTGQCERECHRSHHPPHCRAPLCANITTSSDLKQGMSARSRAATHQPEGTCPEGACIAARAETGA